VRRQRLILLVAWSVVVVAAIVATSVALLR
jgi:hypothetical protein